MSKTLIILIPLLFLAQSLSAQSVETPTNVEKTVAELPVAVKEEPALFPVKDVVSDDKKVEPEEKHAAPASETPEKEKPAEVKTVEVPEAAPQPETHDEVKETTASPKTTPAETESTTPRIHEDVPPTTAPAPTEKKIAHDAPIPTIDLKTLEEKKNEISQPKTIAKKLQKTKLASSVSLPETHKPLAEMVHELIEEHKQLNRVQKKTLPTADSKTESETKTNKKSKKATKKPKTKKTDTTTSPKSSTEAPEAEGDEAKKDKKSKKLSRSKKINREEIVKSAKGIKLVVIRNGDVVELTKPQIEDLDAIVKSMSEAAKKEKLANIRKHLLL